jgi:hypothetical protein
MATAARMSPTYGYVAIMLTIQSVFFTGYQRYFGGGYLFSLCGLIGGDMDIDETCGDMRWGRW